MSHGLTFLPEDDIAEGMVFISENIPDGLESLLDSTYVSGTYRQIQPPQHPNKSSPPLSMCHRPPTYPLYVGVECSYNHQWRWLKNQQHLWGMDIFVPPSGKPLKAFTRIKPRLLCVSKANCHQSIYHDTQSSFRIDYIICVRPIVMPWSQFHIHCVSLDSVLNGNGIILCHIFVI